MDQRRPPEYTLSITADRASVKDVVKGILHTIFFHRYFTPLYPATHDVLDITLPYVAEDDIATLVDARATALVRQLDASLAATASPASTLTPTSATTTNTTGRTSPFPSSSSSSSPAGAPSGYPSAGSPYYPSSTTAGSKQPGRGQIVVQFLEKKRRKGWFVAKADEETVWECWVVDVTMFAPGGGGSSGGGGGGGGSGGGMPEASPSSTTAAAATARTRRQMERSVQRAAWQVVAAVNRERAHIPPITTNDANPFPYQILVNPGKPDGWGSAQKMSIF